jgi:predicted phosphodiesterase
MLRRRHLGPSEEVLESDFLVIDCLPDIVAYGHDHKPLVNNYKATTLVNPGSLLTQAVPIVVDFKTREWKPIKVLG